MRVILIEDVTNLGKKGDIIEVKNGYALNFLIPKNLAVPATDSEIKKWQSIKEKLAKEEEKQLKELEKVIEKIKNTVIVFKRKTTKEGKLFGSVSKKDILKELSVLGYNINEDWLDEVHLKELGEFEVNIKTKNYNVPIKIKIEKE